MFVVSPVCIIIKLWSLIFICLCLTTIEPQPLRRSTLVNSSEIVSSRPTRFVEMLSRSLLLSTKKLEQANFSNSIQNQTVPIKRQAIFDCSVENLANYKVAWLKRDDITNDTTLLSLDDKLIISNNENKFKILKMMFQSNQNWRLIINNVQLSDKGHYMCQLSTKPVKYQSAYLDVHIPPKILDSQTTANLVQVDEFQRLELRCHAQGYPKPEIEWKKETLANEDETTVTGFNNTSYRSLITLARGNSFTIDRVTRFEAGVYLCIANNRVPPAVSHRITVRVNYGPIVNVISKTKESALGGHAELSCQIEAFPPVIDVRWIRSQDQAELNSDNDNDNPMTVQFDSQAANLATTQSDKYNIKSESRLELRPHYHNEVSITTSKLIIFNVQQHDYGSYQCLASNNLTNRDAHIRLHEAKGSDLVVALPVNTSGAFINEAPQTHALADDLNALSDDSYKNSLGETTVRLQPLAKQSASTATVMQPTIATNAHLAGASNKVTATTKMLRQNHRDQSTNKASVLRNSDHSVLANSQNTFTTSLHQTKKQMATGQILLVGNSGATSTRVSQSRLLILIAAMVVTLHVATRLFVTTTLH